MAAKKISRNQVIPKLDFAEIVVLNIRLLQVFGYILPEFQSNVRSVAHLIYAVLFVGSMLGTMLISELVNMSIVISDVEEITNASFLTLTHLVHASKCYYLYKYRNRVRLLLKGINRREFQPKNTYQYNTLKSYVRNSKMITTIFLVAGLVTCSFWGLYPFIDKGNVFLPLAGWYPFDTSHSPVFELTYAYQIVAATINAWANISIDSFMSGLIMVVCAQLHILNDSIRSMRQHAEMKLDDNGTGAEKEISQKLQEKMDEQLIECVIHHRCILEFADEVTFLFTKSILGQFIVSVVIICITLFEITLLPWSSLKFFSLIIYQFCMLLEIFLLCYYGNEVIRESMELTKFAYCTDWMDCSAEFKRNLLFFMTRSQRELRLYAGGFFTLSLETFVKILRSSWSYFAVLNTVHSVEDKDT